MNGLRLFGLILYVLAALCWVAHGGAVGWGVALVLIATVLADCERTNP